MTPWTRKKELRRGSGRSVRWKQGGGDFLEEERGQPQELKDRLMPWNSGPGTVLPPWTPHVAPHVDSGYSALPFPSNLSTPNCGFGILADLASICGFISDPKK